jgi:hypothetical protein
MALSSTPLTETSAFTANVYPPQPNSGIASNDIAAPLQALANRTKFLNDTKFDKAGGAVTDDIVMSPGVNTTFSAARSYTRSVRGLATFDATEWQQQTSGTYWIQGSAPGSGGTQMPLAWFMDVPPGSTITGVSWKVDGAGGHGALPANMPLLTLRDVDAAAGSSTSIATVNDASASVVAYEAAHTNSSGVLSHLVAEGHVIVAAVLGEKGANEVSGALHYYPVITFTRTESVEA